MKMNHAYPKPNDILSYFCVRLQHMIFQIIDNIHHHENKKKLLNTEFCKINAKACFIASIP